MCSPFHEIVVHLFTRKSAATMDHFVFWSRRQHLRVGCNGCREVIECRFCPRNQVQFTMGCCPWQPWPAIHTLQKRSHAAHRPNEPDSLSPQSHCWFLQHPRWRDRWLWELQRGGLGCRGIEPPQQVHPQSLLFGQWRLLDGSIHSRVRLDQALSAALVPTHFG